MISLRKSWQNVANNWAYYWKQYGGIKALFASPYFGIAIILSMVSIYWGPDKNWVDSSLAIIPSLLGFSIGGFAILLVFSSDRFLAIISEEGSENSLFLKASVTFVHFIVVQVFALVTIMLAYAGVPFMHTVAIIGLYYSVMTALAACFVLFDIAQVYNSASGVFNCENSQEANPRVESDSNAQPPKHRRVG
ncbi:MAG: hypothetical protein IPG25_15230 [Proteobacteria bacterium]|jgi:hypothetical protein|uniref:Uncharacterized protein n=1 Tax=Candidatus Dojkabacteria bacterium TaxID=2099670 RepID=A0A5C7JBA6_9BACT|nr:hypothetical protein [Pseudomonadota bacterium]TXG78424.1 MAG: hypothetical protein E6Q11_01000 [Candidatus Dojkabacteria bacterium]